MAESIQGTSIPPASSIVDTWAATWTMHSGVVYRNARATPSSSVMLLLYFNHTVYQQNVNGYWWKWNNAITVGNSWVATTDPRPAPTPKPTPTPVPTPPPHLPVGETRADFYLDDKLVNSGKLVPK